MSKSAKSTTASSKRQSPSGSSPFVETCHRARESILAESTTEDVLEILPDPVLVWPLPGYIPPPQRSSQNRFAIARSVQRKKLKDQLGWQLKSGEAFWDGSIPEGPSVVCITTWKDGRRYDQGNFVQACKALLDALSPDIIVDDHIIHCADFYSQRLAKKDKMETGTLVVVHRVHRVASKVRRVILVGEQTRSCPGVREIH